MEHKKFSSSREEALEIAYTARKDLLDGRKDVVSLLRACLVVASNLNKSVYEKWINNELYGNWGTEVPQHRFLNCPYEWQGKVVKKSKFVPITMPIHMLVALSDDKDDISVSIDKNTYVFLKPAYVRSLIPRVEDKCLLFLNEIIRELQYGGIVEYLMEEIRNNVDEKLAKLDETIAKEVESLYTNLSSTNPADWTKVAHSCRRILMFVADKLFPPSDKKYTMKDGSLLEVGEPHFINRLCAFADQKLSGDQRKFLIAETKYLENYLHQVVEFAQMGEHNKTLEKFDADMIAIHTYLIISDILKLMPVFTLNKHADNKTP